MTSAAAPVSLRVITAETVRDVTRLTVREDQKQFVAPNAISLAQALFAPEAWYRAIYAGEALAGFVMLYDESLRPHPPQKPEIGVWRFMVDAEYQGKGVGKEGLELVIAYVRSKAIFDKLELSYVPGPGGPEDFYRRLGFEPTGKVDEGEVVLALQLGPNVRPQKPSDFAP